jgi:hypothetical protein
MTKVINILSIIIVFPIIGCSIFESETNNLEPIEGNILFSVTYDSTEILSSHSGFLLLMKTEKIYSCCNFEIKTFISSNQNKINVKLLGIYLQDICATALGPAKSRIPLDISSGEYELTFNYKQQTDKYTLSIDEFNVAVTNVDTSFTVYKPYNFSF